MFSISVHSASSKRRPLHFNKKRVSFLIFLAFFIGLSLSWVGFHIGIEHQRHQGPSQALYTQWTQEVRGQHQEALIQLQDKHQRHIDALTRHVGKLESSLLRLNALGEQLVQAADLDPQEFNFDQDPALGGPITPNPMRLPYDLKAQLSRLNHLMDRRYEQLSTIHDLLVNQSQILKLNFSGLNRPVKSGWISSLFGYRIDPITGKQAWHSGIDFSGKEGSPIFAIASGVVTFAGKKGGYGNLLELNHGHGLSTRYGHNQKLLVKAGQIVEQGQVIACMGHTGRATGSHVHLEVRKQGKAVDPAMYIRGMKRK